MEERKQLSVSDKNGILNELTRKGYTQEVVDLVKEDLDFGLSQEQTQLYLLKKLDIRQMRVQSQCIRNGYSDDVIAVIMCDGLNGYQMQIALSLELFVNGSLNIFNHQTNVDIENRFIVYVNHDT